MTQNRSAESPADSGWTEGGLVFAATMMLMTGVFHAVLGFAAILDDRFFVLVRGYAFDLDITGWGWIHLILGLAAVAAGIGLFARAAWAVVLTLCVTVLSAVDNFFFIPYAPLWSLLLIALDVWIIWALTRPGSIRF
jgi:hypothetical protein